MQTKSTDEKSKNVFKYSKHYFFFPKYAFHHFSGIFSYPCNGSFVGKTLLSYSLTASKLL